MTESRTRIFCEKDNNLLVEHITENDMYLVCESCKEKYNINPIDTLRYEDNKTSNIQNFAKIIRRIPGDKASPKIKNKCTNKKCNYEFARFARLGENSRKVIVCMKCGNIEL